MNNTQTQPTLYINRELMLPDTNQWQFRMEIESETSNRVYVVSQNIKKRHWGCSCMGYRRYRKCKHLEAMGLPSHETPYEPKIIER